MRACLKCGEAITGRRSDALYCSKRCSSAAGNQRYWATQGAKRVRRVWLVTNEGKLSRERYLHSPKSIAGAIRRTRAWRARNAAAWSAHKAVKRALAAGILVKPTVCEDCGRRERLDAHHDDYMLPLVVRWVCRRCHFARHGRLMERATS